MKRTAAAALFLLACKPHAPPPAASEARLAAIDRCKQGYASLGSRSHVDWPSLVVELARGCADIFSEPACAAAMRNAPADPTQFATTLGRACRDAYCPHLPAPRPKLCDRRDLPPPTELFAQWAEMHQLLMERELGLPPGALASLFPRVPLSPTREVAPDAPAPAPVRVYAKREGSDRMRVWIDGGKAVVVPTEDAASRLESLVHDAGTRAPVDTQVIFAVDKNVPYGAVIALMDAFKQEGFSRFAFSVEKAAEKK